MQLIKTDTEVIQQVFDHIDNGTTDLGDECWQEPVVNYTDPKRLEAEIALFKHLPMVYAPSDALPNSGSYFAREVAGVPLLVVRDKEMKLKAFRNACRHRGMTIAEGRGQTKVFRCTYHGWAYGIDGALQHVPHETGFPGLNKDANALVPIHQVEEHGGLIFVNIEPPIDDGALSALPPLLDDTFKVFDTSEYLGKVNWKLNIEATLEGYHIKPTHEKTFYPYGFDNLNVVESFGRNGRITFPFRRIESLRDVPIDERDISGKVTYVYNVFPNCTVAFLTNHVSVTIAEPVSPMETYYYSFRLGKLKGIESDNEIEKMQRDARFVAESGLVEDNEVIRRIQAGLNSEANTHFNYGLYEKAIVHLHKNLASLLHQ